jgi:hypothetical protein
VIALELVHDGVDQIIAARGERGEDVLTAIAEEIAMRPAEKSIADRRLTDPGQTARGARKMDRRLDMPPNDRLTERGRHLEEYDAGK